MERARPDSFRTLTRDEYYKLTLDGRMAYDVARLLSQGVNPYLPWLPDLIQLDLYTPSAIPLTPSEDAAPPRD